MIIGLSLGADKAEWQMPLLEQIVQSDERTRLPKYRKVRPVQLIEQSQLPAHCYGRGKKSNTRPSHKNHQLTHTYD